MFARIDSKQVSISVGRRIKFVILDNEIIAFGRVICILHYFSDTSLTPDIRRAGKYERQCETNICADCDANTFIALNTFFSMSYLDIRNYVNQFTGVNVNSRYLVIFLSLNTTKSGGMVLTRELLFSL